MANETGDSGGDAQPPAGHTRSPRDVVVTAVCLGILVGILEGAGWVTVQRLGRLTPTWTQVLWIAPVLDGLVFLAVGCGLALLLRLARWRWLRVVAFFVLFALSAAVLTSVSIGPYIQRPVLALLILGIASALYRVHASREAAATRWFRRMLPYAIGAVVLLIVGIQGFYAVRERVETRSLAEAPAGVPDVVVVVIDALRADHLSAYGYERPTSPFIDELATGGVLFERAIAASPYSLPSHASLLSGLIPSGHGVEWLAYDAFRDGDYPSIAEAMRDLGYRTGAFSANPFWFTRKQGFGRGFLRFEDIYHTPADMAYRTVFGNNFQTVKFALGFEALPGRKLGTFNTDRVIDWATADADRPFFAFINYFDVHAPYTPPQPYRSRFSDSPTPPGGILNWEVGRKGAMQLTPEQRQSEIDGYDGAIAYVDAEIRRLLETLRAARPGRETLVIVTSDHGEAFGEHGGYLHARSLYREELHVPLILNGPGVPAGLRIDRPVSHLGIAGTILELVTGRPPTQFGERSLVRLWTDPAAAERWPMPVAEAAQRDWVDPSFPMRHGYMASLVSPEWHFIYHETLPCELYGWDDPREQVNRMGDPELEDEVKVFEAVLSRRTDRRTSCRHTPPS